MKADLTRTTFDPAKHFSGVLLQQGRVQVDADWNELVDVQHHVDRTARIDEVGPLGAPIEAAGFAITAGGGGLAIGTGRIYVDGILCEAEGTAPIAFAAQPHLPGVGLPTRSGIYAIAIDVHERLVTALQDAELREVALGGADHAVRTQVVWQVRPLRLGDLGDSIDCISARTHPSWVAYTTGSTGTLQVRTVQAPSAVDPCTVPAQAGYRGLENQLYRVEIHDGSHALADGEWVTKSGDVTFKWSRENGTVVTKWTGTPVAGTLAVGSLGRDTKRGFGPGHYVELESDDLELRREPGSVVRIDSVDPDEPAVDVTGSVPDHATIGANPRLRRWDSKNGVEKLKGTWVALESGIEVKLQKTGAVYQTGDYWLIPARSITGQVEWPSGLKATPHGPRHHHGLLALASYDDATGQWTVLGDCRPLFPAATRLTNLEYLGGDGQEAMPGNWLPLPLRVGVSNGEYPVEGARVRFTVSAGDGSINTSKSDSGAVSGGSIEVATDADGRAEIHWKLPDPPPAKPDPRLTVRAELLDHAGQPLHLEVRFGAQVSVAANVWYDSSGCAHWHGSADTVQEALDELCGNHGLHYVSGDGQEGLPDEALPVPLRARVANGRWSAEKAVVELALVDPDHGSLTALPGLVVVSSTTVTETVGPDTVTRITSLRVESGADGVVGVTWTLGRKPTVPHQQVKATLLHDDGSGLAPTDASLVYNATIPRARDTRFDARCKGLQAAKTVADALDRLCANASLHYVSGDGQQGRPGRVLPMSLRVRVANGDWPKKAFVMFEVLSTQSYGKALSLADSGAVKGMNPVPWGRGRGEIWSDKYVVETDERGIAQAQWMLGLESRLSVQRVRATLLDDDKQPTIQHVIYSAFVTSSDPKVTALYAAATGEEKEAEVAPGGVLPDGFLGFRFHDLLVDVPPGDTKPKAWWPGVEVAAHAPVDAASDATAYQWLVLRGPVEARKDGSLVWRVRAPAQQGTLGREITLADATRARDVPFLAERQPVAVAVAPRMLVRVQLRPSLFPGGCAADAADFELYAWVRPTSGNG